MVGNGPFFDRSVIMRWAAALVLVLAASVSHGAEAPSRHVLILGFDGAEPSIVEAMLNAGELPNLKALRGQGTFQRLRTTIPPQSPTAWSSFATCKNPGNHGIYDFLRRNAFKYQAMPGFGATKQPELAPDGSVSKAAFSMNYRKGLTFWSVADAQGARCKLFHIPFSYPADKLSDSCMLCGEGVPDIRGVTTTFVSLSDSFTPEQLNETVAGGVRIPLKFENNSATATISGAVDPRKAGEYVKTPMTVTADRGTHTVTVEFQRQKVSLSENSWSDWLEWTFTITPKYSVRAISRIHVLEAGAQVRLYMTSLQFHPKAPLVAFSEPKDYSGELADRYGLYKTVGWSHDTHALRQGGLSEEAFLDDAKTTDEWLARLTLDEMERGGFRLLVTAWTSTDRVAHMFWRFRDPKHPQYTAEGARKYGRVLEDTYKRMDAIVGKVMAKLGQDDLLMVMSDHGFHSFRKGFNVNTWLVRNGYLAVMNQPDPANASNPMEFLQGYDWSGTKAYGLGLGSVYLNLKGREGQGIVNPADAPSLIAELKGKLLALTDPETGDKVFNAVYTRDDFGGAATAADAPDLQLGYAEGYQTSKKSAKGSAPPQLFEPNDDKWSGEHAASDAESTSGMLFINRPAAKDAAIIDLGVTTLKYLDLKIPADFQGKPVL